MHSHCKSEFKGHSEKWCTSQNSHGGGKGTRNLWGGERKCVRERGSLGLCQCTEVSCWSQSWSAPAPLGFSSMSPLEVGFPRVSNHPAGQYLSYRGECFTFRGGRDKIHFPDCCAVKMYLLGAGTWLRMKLNRSGEIHFVFVSNPVVSFYILETI